MLEKGFSSDMPQLNKYIRENKNLMQIQPDQKMFGVRDKPEKNY